MWFPEYAGSESALPGLLCPSPESEFLAQRPASGYVFPALAYQKKQAAEAAKKSWLVVFLQFPELACPELWVVEEV